MTTHPHPTTQTLLPTALISLRTTTSLLSSSISILASGTSDLPRLTKVLTQTRHFELVPSSSLAAAQEAVLGELVPEVDSLLRTVEREVERSERREQGLRARWELQEGRLGREASASGARISNSGTGAASTAQSRAATEEQDRKAKQADARTELKAKQLRAKKQRLSYAVERLTLQANQTERKLRQSMAAQEGGVSGAAGGVRELKAIPVKGQEETENYDEDFEF